MSSGSKFLIANFFLWQDGQLSVGDEILAVGEESIQGLSYEKVCDSSAWW